jgi:dolichol kinase
MTMNPGSALFTEYGRKAVHLVSIFIVLFYYVLGKTITLNILTLVLVIFMAIEYFRVERKEKVPIVWRFYRPEEEGKIGGNVAFMMGAIIAISVFSREIASVAILMTTFGDMAAALVGTAYGKRWIPGLPERAWEGVVAEFVVDLVIGVMFLPVIIVIPMALAATFVETIIYKLDDNLMIPIFAGAVGQLMSIII